MNNNKDRKITYSAYKIGNKTAVVCAIYKTENAPNVNNSLLKLMEAEINNKIPKNKANSFANNS